MYIPADEEDYFIQTGKLSKTLAANVAQADLTGIRVPYRQDDGTYADAEGDKMMREDMADYFTRLRAAQEAAEAMDDEEEAAAPLPARPRLVVSKSQPRGAKRRTNPLKH